jgi:hypothetical protein
MPADYAQQAEAEMWDAIASQDRERDALAGRIQERRPSWDVLQAHRQVAEDLAAGRRRTAPREVYRPIVARYAGKCDYCGARVRRGDRILYSSLLPVGHKVVCSGCDEGRL